MPVALDTSEFPLVRWAVAGRMTVADVDELRERYLQEVLVHAERFVQLWDLSSALPPDPRVRHAMVELSTGPLQAHERRFLVAEAWVATTWLVRGALSAVKLITRPSYLCRIVGTLDEAEHFVHRHHPLHPRRLSSKPPEPTSPPR
ncbi:MAG: hypothetical protein KF901_24175 [Myxococcales bacterium]|nr:hypothetical protein [Myxococcales bacterium]